MLEGEALKARAVIGKDGNVMIGLYADLFRCLVASRANGPGLLEFSLRLRKSIGLFHLLLFLRRWRGSLVTASYPLLIDDENQQGENDR
jgi:hypothetical protein